MGVNPSKWRELKITKREKIVSNLHNLGGLKITSEES
jgi:hypothetical protein